MATPAQLAANRANAQRSTGPRSVEGKSVSRFNALKHGADASSIVLPDEDPAAYQALADSYDHAYNAENVIHRALIDCMIHADWQKQRLLRLEADLIRKLLSETPGATLADILFAEAPGVKILLRTQRQIAAHERAWFRAHRELVRLITNLAFARQAGLEPPYEPAEPEEIEMPERTQFPAPKAAKPWPPVDEKGKPLYFVG